MKKYLKIIILVLIIAISFISGVIFTKLTNNKYDVNKDGKITPADATLILQKYVTL